MPLPNVTANSGRDGGFQRALTRFKSHLSPTEQEEFSVTSLEDVQEAIAKIQDTQASKRNMRNLNRIKSFLEAMEQYGKVVEVFLNVSEILAFVWGPVKFLLQTASTWVESFDVLLDAYEEISENIPQLLEYGELFKQHAHMRKILEMMYGDILEFHKRALKFFSRPTWKQLFHSSWKNFRTQFQYLLSSLSRHKVLIEKQASLVEYEQSKAARLALQNRFEEIAKNERLRRHLAVTDKIHPPNISADHEAATEIRQEYPDSGKWILRHPLLRVWLDFTRPKVPVLWVNGIPGAGKSVIASLIIEESKTIDSVNVGFFYCKYCDNQKNSFVKVLRSILVQLVQRNEELLSYVYEKCCSNSEVTMDSESILKQLVETAVGSCPNACIIIDGIDECEEAEERKTVAWFLAMFKNATKDDGATIRLLFISQRDKVTESLLTQASAIPLDSKYHQQDIQAYAAHRSIDIQRKFGISESSASKIGADVAAQARGLFLYAKLVLTLLENQTTQEKLFRELQPDSFPTGLEAVYERIAGRIFENPNLSEREEAHNIFRWIICARRPLNWRDIQCISAIDPNVQTVDFEGRQLRVTCRDLCGSLVEIGVGDTLELVHRSAKLYLIKTGRVRIRSEELHIADFCLRYLNFGCFDANLTDVDIRGFFRQGYYSFEDYAIAFWLDHVDSGTSQPLPLEANGLECLARNIGLFLNKHGSASPQNLSSPSDQKSQCIRQCDFAQRLDSLALLARERRSNEDYLDLEVQLHRRRSIYEEDIVANTDLHKESVPTLLHLSRCSRFKCPKIWCESFSLGFQHREDRDKHVNQHERAFRCSFEGCVRAELGYETEKELKRHEKDSHPTVQSSEWAFPTLRPKKKLDIFSASERGDLATVEQLVGEGTDVNQTTRPNGSITPLSLALKHKHSHVVRYLIEQGTKTAREEDITNAMAFASVDTLKLLFDMASARGGTSLAWPPGLVEAAGNGRLDVLPLLLTYGLDLSNGDQAPQLALEVARRKGHHAFAQALLDKGAPDLQIDPVVPEESPPDSPFLIPFNEDLANPDILANFDFEHFLQTTDSDFNFDPSILEP